VSDERFGPAVLDVNRLVDEIVGLRGLLGDGVNTGQHRQPAHWGSRR
jgi:hypothetical protein